MWTPRRELCRSIGAALFFVGFVAGCASGDGTQNTYVVKSGDSLVEIAKRFCGDPEAWIHIYEANVDQPQPDGRVLSDPSIIEVGWELIISCTSGAQGSEPEAASPTSASPGATDDPDEEDDSIEKAHGDEFEDPTEDESGEARSNGSAMTYEVRFEIGDYVGAIDLIEQILASDQSTDEERTSASVYHTVASLRLGMIDAATAEITLEEEMITGKVTAKTEEVLDEGLLEAYVLQEKGDEAAEVLSRAPEIVIQRFREARPDLLEDLQRLVPDDVFDERMAPSG